VLQRRMGREHVVVGVDDADVQRTLRHHRDRAQSAGALLVSCGHGRKGMGHIGTAQAAGTRCAGGVGVDLRQVGAAGRPAALGNAGGDGGNGGVKVHGWHRRDVTKLQNEW